MLTNRLFICGCSWHADGSWVAYRGHYAEETAKDRAASAKECGISTPGLKGSPQEVVFGSGTGKGKKGSGGKGGRKSAEALATGGTRNTSITMSISKFFDYINVYMNDRTDTAELEERIIQSMNRALAIATSTER